MGSTWIPAGWIGVKDAAKRMGVADKTIRRRIEAGELEAKLIPSPYGRDMWVVFEDQIQTAQKVLDVIEVKQEYELQDIVFTLSQFILERDASRDAQIEQKIQELTQTIQNTQRPVLDEIRGLREENKELRELIEQSLTERDQEVMAQIREKLEEKKKPWWRFW